MNLYIICRDILTMMSLELPSLSSISVLTGAISASYHPFFHAAAALKVKSEDITSRFVHHRIYQDDGVQCSAIGSSDDPIRTDLSL